MSTNNTKNKIDLDISNPLIILSVPVIAILFGFQEELSNMIGYEAIIHLFLSLIGGWIVFLAIGSLMPIREFKKNMDKLPKLNFEYINNFDSDMDHMRDVLRKINQLIEEDNYSKNIDNYLKSACVALDRVSSRIKNKEVIEATINAKNKIESLDTSKGLSEKSREFGLVSSSKVQTYELDADSVWIMSNSLRIDTTDEMVKENVVKNLKGEYTGISHSRPEKARYCYIVPDTPDINMNIEKLIKYWLDKRVSLLDISHVRFIKLPTDRWLQAHDVTIYNGDSVKRETDKEKKLVEFIELGDDIDIFRKLDFKKESNFVGVITNIILNDTNKGKQNFSYKNKDGVGIWNINSEYFVPAMKEVLHELKGSSIELKDMNGNLVELTQRNIENLIKSSKNRQAGGYKDADFIENFSKKIDEIHNSLNKK